MSKVMGVYIDVASGQGILLMCLENTIGVKKRLTHKFGGKRGIK